ncbi:MAG: hypothetical protein KDK89_13540 [Alphaproteobacteria bacterium]|nr:hypothetical protein [Alphaproteobacteria bacterium]
MNVTIAGDSHIGVLAKALVQMQEEGMWPADLVVRCDGANEGLWRQGFYADQGDRLDIVDLRFRRILGFHSLSLGEPVDQVLGLCVHYHSNRFWRHRQWLKFAPMGMQTKETPLSRQLIEQMALDDQEDMLNFTRLLRRFGLKVFAIEAPRPFRDHEAIARMKLRLDVVVAVDRMYRTAIRLALEGMSVPTLGIPLESLGSDGFMKPEYRSDREGDKHHANVDHGRLMMQQLPAFLAKHFGEAQVNVSVAAPALSAQAQRG